MGFIDKLKNVFFEEIEEEEVEKEEPVKLAKKVELPKKKIEKVRVEREKDFSNDLEPDSDNVSFKEEKLVSMEEEFAPSNHNNNLSNNKFPVMLEEEDIFDNDFNTGYNDEPDMTENRSFSREEKLEKRELYQGKKEVSYIESVNKTPAYTYTKTYYENKETAKNFKPSPIISPIYGILDKNYRKEEVVTRKEIKTISNNHRKVDLDSVRNKAFGQNEDLDRKDTPKEVKTGTKKEENKVYDINRSKPTADNITLADADEYYNDLGLAYNVDYGDSSRNQYSTRTRKYHENNQSSYKNSDSHSNSKSDDNLFDLIDSMYSKEE